MNLQEFQKCTEQTDNIDLARPRGSSVLSFGVLGEFGSFISEIKNQPVTVICILGTMKMCWRSLAICCGISPG